MLQEDDENCCIAVGEPRIIAATQLAHRVADQRGERIGHPNCQVGFFTGREHEPPARQVGSVSYCLYDTLYHRLQDVAAREVSHMIINEVHEWNIANSKYSLQHILIANVFLTEDIRRPWMRSTLGIRILYN